MRTCEPCAAHACAQALDGARIRSSQAKRCAQAGRTEPSAPTEANTLIPAAKATSYTSLSCAISCVFA